MDTNNVQQDTSIADLFVHPGATDPAAPAPQSTPPVDPAQVAVPGAPSAPVPPPAHMVPLSELLDTRHRAQAAEFKAQQVQEQLQAFQRSLEARYAPQPLPIDPVSDPEGAFRAVAERIAVQDQRLQEQALHQRANMSEMLARKEFGAQTVETAREAALKAGLGDHFLRQADPYQSVVEWHRGQTVAKEIGDPVAYREKIKAEILAELRGQPVRPGASQVLPPSLSSATRASAAGPVVTDSSDFFKNMLKKG